MDPFTCETLLELLRPLQPGSGRCDVQELQQAMQEYQLDFASPAVQEFGSLCTTATDGVVDYTRFLAVAAELGYEEGGNEPEAAVVLPTPTLAQKKASFDPSMGAPKPPPKALACIQHQLTLQPDLPPAGRYMQQQARMSPTNMRQQRSQPNIRQQRSQHIGPRRQLRAAPVNRMPACGVVPSESSSAAPCGIRTGLNHPKSEPVLANVVFGGAQEQIPGEYYL